MHVVFRNNGEIDPRAFSSFGVNVKVNESPIGYFGTGLKYALAVLLREGCKINVYSGLNKIDFGLRDVEFRGETFQFVTMTVEGEPERELGFTSELGKNWKPWMVYRELACNCMDEKGDVYLLGYTPEPEKGTTFITVTGDKFLTEYARRGETFLQAPVIAPCKDVTIHLGASNKSYYRGVRISEHKGGLYTYNVQRDLAITEDRTAKEPSDIRHMSARAIAEEVSSIEVIANVLTCSKDNYETDFDFDWPSWQPSEIFLSTVEKLVEVRFAAVNPTAVILWKAATAKKVKPKAILLSSVQLKAIEKAVAFCKRIDFPVDDYRINFSQSLGGDCIALAHDGQIFLSERVLQQGTKQIAATLIEEYIHLRYGYEDCTRKLQTYLFDVIVSMGEQILNEPI